MNFTGEIRRDLLTYFPATRAGAAAALSRLRSIEDYLTDEERAFLANEKDPAVAGS